MRGVAPQAERARSLARQLAAVRPAAAPHSLVVQEEELIKPFQQLEEQRVRLAAEIAGHPSKNGEGTAVTVTELIRHLAPSDALRISTISTRLRTVSERIIHMNDQNRILLQRSVRFVQETLRLVTDDHTRQLVDHRV